MLLVGNIPNCNMAFSILHMLVQDHTKHDDLLDALLLILQKNRYKIEELGEK